MKRYDDARAETERALAHRSWALRDREGVAALRSSCRLLSGLTTAVGDQLRDGWYRKRLRALYEAGTLREYETEPMPGRGPDFHKRLGVDQNELSLLDNVSARELRDVDLGGDGNARRNIPAGTLEGGNSSNERDPLNACFGGDKFPLEQGLGGVVFLKHAILPFHCDQRLGAESEFAELEASGEGWRRNPRSCYTGNGPCYSCCSDDFPQPTHSFPAWVPALPPGATVTAPHSEMDVFYSKDAVPPRLKQQLTSVLDTLGKKRRHFPMPHYHNIVDPNVNVGADGLWVPTEFDVLRVPLVPVEIAALVELACLESTGQRMPFPIGHVIVELANGDGTETRGECAMRTPIPDLDPHENFKLHLAMQRLMTCALPLLGRLRRPALLLPGPLQAVVKAQRIFLDEGEDYAGVWHEDGMDEHIVAVVLYYYRAPARRQSRVLLEAEVDPVGSGLRRNGRNCRIARGVAAAMQGTCWRGHPRLLFELRRRAPRAAYGGSARGRFARLRRLLHHRPAPPAANAGTASAVRGAHAGECQHPKEAAQAARDFRLRLDVGVFHGQRRRRRHWLDQQRRQ